MSKIKIQIYITFSILVTLWCAGIIAAPELKHSNSKTGANAIYLFFSHICHQDDAKSFHIEGEKLGVCIRCTAIYFGSLLAILLMPVCGAIKRGWVPNKIALLASILPMLIDVALNYFNLHASNTTTRVITGALFGAVVLWWVMPLLIEACLQLIQKKKNRSQNSGVYSYAGEAQ